MLALIRYNVLARLRPRRWGVVLVFFVALLVVYISDIRCVGSPGEARAFNVWDVGLCVLFDYFLPSFGLLLGFVLLGGDDLTSARADGTLQVTLLRSGSTLRWWLAKVAAWGVLAFGFMTVFLVATIVASLLCSVPVELQNSAASAEGHRSFSRWYLLPPGWSTMAYDIALVGYAAVVIWALYTVYMALSLFVFPSLSLSYVGFFLVYGASLWITGRGSMLSVSFFLSPVKHFSGLGHARVSPEQFGGLLVGLLTCGTAAGYLRLRRLQL